METDDYRDGRGERLVFFDSRMLALELLETLCNGCGSGL